MAKEKICGIYKIENLINHKLYIGSSVNIDTRWNTHRCGLRKNKHGNGHLQKAWNKYGEEAFIFEILEKCDKDLLIEKEQYWMDLFLSYNDKFGYNIVPKSDRSELSPESIRKSLEKRKGLHVGINNPCCKLTNEIVKIIIDYLQNTDLSFYKIANILSVNKSTVSEIYYKNQ